MTRVPRELSLPPERSPGEPQWTAHAQSTSRSAAPRHVPPPIPPFEEVYEAHFDFVWRSALHRGVPHAQLDDVTQEVFLIVHRQLPGFEGRASLRTWIGGIVRRVVADFRKKRGNRPAGDHPLDEVVLPADGRPDPVEQQAAIALLERLVQSMSPEQREVFLLRELEHLSGTEIAAIVGENENTVWTRIRAARRIFSDGVARERARLARESL